MSNLLKEAIADAKAVRATALANAKLALQEHFSEALTAQLSEKLRNELQDEEGEDTTAPVDPTAAPVDAPAVSPEVAPEADISVTAPATDVSVVTDPTAPVVPPTDVAPDAIQETEDPQGAKVKYTVIGNTPAMKGSTPSEPSKPLAGAKTTDATGIKGQFKDQYKDSTKALEEGEQSDEDELKSIKEELEADCEKEEDGEDEDKTISETEMPSTTAPVTPATAEQTSPDETVNFEELMAEIEAEITDEAIPQVDPVAQTQPAMEALQLEIKNLKKTNSQYNEAISFMRGKLNEVNLLNAKLLYTNKLFKAGNLSNPQKLKIVENMDLARNVREVKLVFSTLAESINFGAKSPIVTPQKVAVKTITEGLASKSVASTKPTKEVLTEGTEMATRFQKLAGIKKTVL